MRYFFSLRQKENTIFIVKFMGKYRMMKQKLCFVFSISEKNYLLFVLSLSHLNEFKVDIIVELLILHLWTFICFVISKVFQKLNDYYHLFFLIPFLFLCIFWKVPINSLHHRFKSIFGFISIVFTNAFPSPRLHG